MSIFSKNNPERNGTAKKRLFRMPKKRNFSHIEIKPRRKFMLPLFLWVVFLATVIYALLFSSFHRITSIDIRGVRAVPSEKLRQSVASELSRKYVGFISLDSYFLVPEQRIRTQLLDAFPKLSSISFEKVFPGKLVVSVSERDQILLWCSGGPCHVISDDGALSGAGSAENEENAPYVLRIVDESARPVRDGEQLLSREYLASFFSLVKLLREGSPLNISAVAVTPSRVSQDIRFDTDEGWQLMTSLSFPPEKVVAALKLIIEKELPVGKRQNLRYVDLRTENRAFYAWKDAPAPVIQPSEDSTPPKDEKKGKKK